MLVFEYWIGRFYSFQNFCLNAGMILVDVSEYESSFASNLALKLNMEDQNLKVIVTRNWPVLLGPSFDVLKWIRVLMGLLNNDQLILL